MIKVRAFIDGYNLYHAICRFPENHLKWIDLWQLCETFVPHRSARLVGVHYFSAYADWLPGPYRRHRTYVAALKVCGVQIHMAHFKTKTRKCRACGNIYQAHEEKETDVDLAVQLLDLARQNAYDLSLIVSRDSDLVPAARVTKAAFPEKELKVVAPPHLGHSNDMLSVVDGKHKIQKKHLESCLLPKRLTAPDGSAIVRPTEYNP